MKQAAVYASRTAVRWFWTTVVTSAVFDWPFPPAAWLALGVVAGWEATGWLKRRK